MMENYNKEEYNEGYVVGVIDGEKAATTLLKPYPYTEMGSEYYQMGYTSGYFARYAQGLSATLKQNSTSEIDDIVATRLEEISECIQNQNNKLNKSIK